MPLNQKEDESPSIKTPIDGQSDSGAFATKSANIQSIGKSKADSKPSYSLFPRTGGQQANS